MTTKSVNLSLWFGPEGRLSHTLERFEHRPEQQKLAEDILSALRDKRRYVAEAGTGVGKTLAYLIPLVLHEKPALIATGTIALQEQLLKKDIPVLRKLGFKIKTHMLKGRSQYLCKLKYEKVALSPPLMGPEAEGWRELATWVKSTRTGDRAERVFMEDQDPLWKSVAADALTCPANHCAHFLNCFLYNARRQAEEADLVVVNHHLLLSDAFMKVTQNAQIIPSFDILLVDEAHLLEETAAGCFTRRLSYGECLQALDHMDLLIYSHERLSNSLLQRWHSIQEKVREALRAVFTLSIPRSGDRIPWEEVQSQPNWMSNLESLRDAWLELQTWASNQGILNEDQQTFLPLIERLVQTCELFRKPETKDLVRYIQFTGENDDSHARWHMAATPLVVDQLLKELLWERYPVTILLSATLRVQKQFDFFLERVGLTGGECLTAAFPSPFELEQTTCLWIPQGLPTPGSLDFLPSALPIIRDVITLVKGRTLVLCTSYQNMKVIAKGLRSQIPYSVMVQGEMAKSPLLDRFRIEVDSVLVATSSFWQGVDVPGEALSCVIIDKIPFDVPTDPIIAARMDQLRRVGKDAFNEYQVPRAALMLRQGFGRLIRQHRDVGLMVLLDSRVWEKRYGKKLICDLAPIPLVQTWKEFCDRWQRIQAIHTSNRDSNKGSSHE